MIMIEPMDESYIHLNCLHFGPVDSLSPPHQGDLWQLAPDLPPHPWSDDVISEVAKQYNNISEGWRGEPSREFMREMIHRYGTCAILAWNKSTVVGHLRFYPLHIAQLLAKADKKKQSIPASNALRFKPSSKTLWVQCVMTSRPYVTVEEAEQVNARKGVGLKLVEGLKTWARRCEWKRIVKQAHADIDAMYGQYGGGGRTFWEKAGFQVLGSHIDEAEYSKEWVDIVESQATKRGMSSEEAWTWYLMAYDL